MRRIAINAGQDGSVIVQEVKTSRKKNYGYDAFDDEFGDMIDKGIVDPAMVTRAALENAVSIASMVLTTNCLITDKPEEGSGAAAAMAAGAPGMY
jgi:chaperonin GroEL